MSEGAIAIVISLLTMLTQVGAIALILFRTKGAKDAVVTSSAQGAVDRQAFVDKVASTVFDMQRDMLAAEREKATYLEQIRSLNTELKGVGELLAKAYGEIGRLNDDVNRLNTQVDKLITRLIEEDTPSAKETVREVKADEKINGERVATVTPTVTQAVKDQVAAAPTPNGLPAAVAENPPVPLPTPSSSVEDTSAPRAPGGTRDKPVVEAAQVPPGGPL